MKTYKYIIINKNNMSRLEHCDRESFVICSLFNKKNQFKPEQFIIIKNENKIINFDPIIGTGGEFIHLFEKAERFLKDQ